MADVLTMRPRSPQLQLEGAHQQEDTDLDTPADFNQRPRTAPRLYPNGFATLNRSSTGLLAPASRNTSRNASPSPTGAGAGASAGAGRPGLQRAKSDFGPRREEVNRAGEESETKEGEWGLRHGFETQLESEEYNRLLESVGHSVYFHTDGARQAS
jgi:regulator-associated protein of mTOR